MRGMHATVLESIEHGQLQNGLFLAERLHAFEQTEASLFLLAKCYHLKGQSRCAYELLQGCTSAENRYLLALCCCALSRHKEAETALLGDLFPSTTSRDWCSHVPNGAYGLTLLGSIYQVLMQTELAVLSFRAALAINPLMWTAIEGLCALGVEENPLDEVQFVASSPVGAAAASAPTITFQHQQQHNQPHQQHQHHQQQQQQDSPIYRNPQASSPFYHQFVTPSSTAAKLVFDTPVAPASVGLTRALASAAIGASHVVSVPEWVDFLRPFASARWNLSQYKCSEALVALKSVDASQHQTAWVCCEMAKAYAEMGEYAMAEQYFGLSQKHSPWRIESMEVYSTVLWHLKKDKKLSDLAHHLVQLDKLAPQTWCVVGNCFSLLKEHDSALRFFQRAIQVDPLFVYAYTLCGHEFVANDDLDQASSFFRNAIRRDPRHYNAWYGLGMIFFRTQRLELAEYHFAQALKINPRSSALHTYLGMVKSKLHGFDQAIRCLDVALSCNPKNLLARLQKAQVLINKGDVEAGRAMVDEMLQSSPREAFLHFLKATACAKLGDRESALMHYTTAFDLDTRNGPLIKARIERLYTNPVVGAEKPIDNDAALEEDFDVVG